MTKLRVHCVSMSLDGYAAGPDQSEEEPLGIGGEQLHDWIFTTRGGRHYIGEEGGTEGVDNDFFARGFDGIGPWIMGRNMFGPVRGSWDSMPGWTGWWGSDPPYHNDVFVLTHHERPPVEMEGGTTFHFVTDGIEVALERARASADGADIRVGGGMSTIRQYLQAGLVDEMHFAIAPITLGAGEPLLAGLGDALDRYETAEHVGSSTATHVVLRRR